MKIKKAFTILELLIVMSILGILMYYMKWIFSYKNVEQVKFDTCYIHTYSKLNKFMQDAFLQKMVYSWDNLEKVGLYTIKFDTTNQKVDFIYSGNELITESILYSWNWTDNINDCYTKSYHTFLSWNDLKIDINPWLQADINDTPVKIYTWNSTTPISSSSSWSMYLYYCQWDDPCLEKYKINIIPSTYLLVSSYCKSVDTNTWKCREWSE